MHTLHVSSYGFFLNEFVRCYLTFSGGVERARNPASPGEEKSHRRWIGVSPDRKH